MMKYLSIFTILLGLGFVGCAKKPAPAPAPEPVVEPEPIPQAPEPVVVPQGPSEAELLAQRVQELLNKILGNKVYFDYDKSDVTQEAKNILSEVGRIMTDSDAGKRISVTAEGHTDDRGTEDYNLALGEKRARRVMEYLESYGVAATRLNIISYGEENPAMSGEDESAWSKNRRAEFKATANLN